MNAKEAFNKILETFLGKMDLETLELVKQTSIDNLSLIYIGGDPSSHLITMNDAEHQILLGSILERKGTFTLYPVHRVADRSTMRENTVTLPKFEGWMEVTLKALKFGLNSRMLTEIKIQVKEIFRKKGLDPEDPIAQRLMKEITEDAGPTMDLEEMVRKMDEKYGKGS